MRTFTRPNHRGQLYYEDLKDLYRGTEIILHGSYFHRVKLIDVSSERVLFLIEGELKEVSSVAFGVVPHDDGMWSVNFWIERCEPESTVELRWQEVGF